MHTLVAIFFRKRPSEQVWSEVSLGFTNKQDGGLSKAYSKRSSRHRISNINADAVRVVEKARDKNTEFRLRRAIEFSGVDNLRKYRNAARSSWLINGRAGNTRSTTRLSNWIKSRWIWSHQRVTWGL